MYSLTFLIKKPLKNIKVMAAFLKKHKRAALGIAPVAAYEAMALVKMSDAFDMIKVYNLSNYTVAKNFLKRSEERSISQNVANKNLCTLFLCVLFKRQWVYSDSSLHFVPL